MPTQFLKSWYPGEEGGTAVAETLSGKNNPAGRLPITFYTGVDQLPPFEDYAMKGRTYRYFEGTPLYPFGYGLSYTTFSYSGLTLPTSAVKAGDPVVAEATVTNTGKVAGDEVVQLYLSFPDVKGAPVRALRGFKRVHLAPGESQKVQFELKDRDLSMVSEAGDPMIAEGQYKVSVGGGQPNTSAPDRSRSVQHSRNAEAAGIARAKTKLRAPEWGAQFFCLQIYLPASLRVMLSPLIGLSLASRKRAQKSVAPPPLTTAARITFGPFLSVMRFETPSSITVCRSL